MSTRVYAWQTDPRNQPNRFLYRCSTSSAEACIEGGRGQFLDVLIDGHPTRVLWLYEETPLAQERAARNQVLVFSGHSNKKQDVILHPHRLHYPVPHAGDPVPLRDLPRWPRRIRFRVSSRSKFNHQAL